MKSLIYDLPTRIFHWVFSGLFVAAFAITKLASDDSPLFSVHMILGMILTFSVILRIFWGLAGSSYARFSTWPLNPMNLLKYFRDLFTGKTELFPGHNPASGWVSVVFMMAALGLATTGVLMLFGVKGELDDIHEVFANALLIAAIAHVLGVVIHTIRHRDPIGLSMITGFKRNIEPSKGIQSTYASAGLIYLLLLGATSFILVKNYDFDNRALSLFGQKLTLKISEKEERRERGGENERHESDEDDD